MVVGWLLLALYGVVCVFSLWVAVGCCCDLLCVAVVVCVRSWLLLIVVYVC